MANLIRCKACGYMTKPGTKMKVCPLCGVPISSFEPYDDHISENRRRILKLHTHPMIVHFPQAFSTLLFAFSILVFFVNSGLKDDILSVSKLISFSLPFFLLAAFLSGIMDSLARYKRIRSPYLYIKVTVGTVYIFLSFAHTFVLNVWGYGSAGSMLSLTLISAAIFGCSIIHGLVGSALTEGELKG